MHGEPLKEDEVLITFPDGASVITKRQRWFVDHLDIVDEPMIRSLIRYRQYEDRSPQDESANVLSSHILGMGGHLPIIDLDFNHEYVPSSTPGHGHLYLNEPIPTWRWIILMWGLYVGRVVEKGYVIWSIRRGGNFVRRRNVHKTTEEEQVKYSYGMFFRLRKKNHG